MRRTEVLATLNDVFDERGITTLECRISDTECEWSMVLHPDNTLDEFSLEQLTYLLEQAELSGIGVDVSAEVYNPNDPVGVLVVSSTFEGEDDD